MNDADRAAAIAAELARVARDIGAPAAGYDNVALAGETLAAWRERIERCAASVAALAERDGEIARLRAQVRALRDEMDGLRAALPFRWEK